MITFPCAKINLGLNVVEERADGYHNLETVFYKLPITDVLEINLMDAKFPSKLDRDLVVRNMPIMGDEQQNLVVKAYDMLYKMYRRLARLHIHLVKRIPTQAGMGGGSSDAAYMIRMVNNYCHLGMTTEKMQQAAATLGADCAFFIDDAKAARAEGIGDILQPIDLDLSDYYIGIVRPDIAVSTKEAYSLVESLPTERKCWDIVKLPVAEWRGLLVNDFEKSVFWLHPELAEIKQKLYDLGAVYAAMSGSGSAIFGLFKWQVDLAKYFNENGTFTYCGKLE